MVSSHWMHHLVLTGRTATVPTVEPNEELLRKPFTIDEFLGVVRRILAAVG